MKTIPSTKDFYALNLTDNQTDKLISKIEADVTQQLTELQSKKEPLSEAEQMYLELKNEVDRISRDLDDNKALLEALIRFKENPRGSKEIRVLRSTSIQDIRERQSRYFKWIQMAMDILRAHDHFMTAEELFQAILKFNANIEKSVGNEKAKVNSLRNSTIHNFKRSCIETRKNNKGKIIDYKGKIGLLEWVLDDFTPDANHIKEFMHGHQNVEL